MNGEILGRSKRVNVAPDMDDSSGPGALMPLSQAAKEVYSKAIGKTTADLDTLNNVARAIAARVRVFTREHGSDEFDLVWPNEIFEGKMQFGGEALHFGDGRPVLENLMIRRDDLDVAVAEIKRLYEKHRI